MPEEKRTITIRYKDGTCKQLTLKHCTMLNKTLGKVGLHLDHLGDNEFLMIVNQELLPTDKRIASILFD